MGDSFDAAAPPALPVKVRATGPIASVEIVKNGAFIYQTAPNTATTEFDFTDTAVTSGTS